MKLLWICLLYTCILYLRTTSMANSPEHIKDIIVDRTHINSHINYLYKCWPSKKNLHYHLSTSFVGEMEHLLYFKITNLSSECFLSLRLWLFLVLAEVYELPLLYNNWFLDLNWLSWLSLLWRNVIIILRVFWKHDFDFKKWLKLNRKLTWYKQNIPNCTEIAQLTNTFFRIKCLEDDGDHRYFRYASLLLENLDVQVLF